MAIYHLTVKTGSRKNGQSAKAKSDYIQRENKYSRDKDEVVYTQSGNMPDWVEKPSEFWDASDLYERSNATLFREVEFALPTELTVEQQKKLAGSFADHLTGKLNLTYTLAIHAGNGDNPHCHLMISERINDGISRTPDKWFKRYNSKEPEKGGAKKADIASRRKDWLNDTRSSWEKHANKALALAGSDARIDHRTLEEQGINRVPQIHIGAKVIEMENRGIKTGRAEIALNVDAANQKIKQLETEIRVLNYEHNIETKKRTERGGIGNGDRAIGDSPSGIIRPSGTVDNSPRGSEQKASGRVDELPKEISRPMDGSSERNEQSRQRSLEHDRQGEADNRGAGSSDLVVGSNGFTNTYSSAADRIANLIQSKSDGAGRDQLSDNSAGLVNDKTYLAVRRQITAMKCTDFEVGIRDKNGQMMSRKWTDKELLNSVPWLKRENAKGADIYIRPSGDKNHGIILVDDVNQGQIAQMKAKGLEPATVIETSPKNYQAWIRVSEKPLDPAIATHISKSIASHFGADANSADWRHYGRLAGFTNKKPEHTNEMGHNPWVLSHESRGKSATNGAALVDATTKDVQNHQAVTERKTRLESALNGRTSDSQSKAIREYQKQLKTLTERYGESMDISKADYMICTSMAKKGYDPSSIVEALEQASPELPTRKAGHELDYCQRTVKAVFAQPEVIQAVTQDKTNSRGFGR